MRNLKVREREIESMLQVSSRRCCACHVRSAVLRLSFESTWFCQRRLASVCQEFVVWALACCVCVESVWFRQSWVGYVCRKLLVSLLSLSLSWPRVFCSLSWSRVFRVPSLARAYEVTGKRHSLYSSNDTHYTRPLAKEETRET